MPADFLPRAEKPDSHQSLTAGLSPKSCIFDLPRAREPIGGLTLISQQRPSKAGFYQQNRAEFSHFGVSASRFCFEVTESRLFFDLPKATVALQRLGTWALTSLWMTSARGLILWSA